LLRHRRVPSLFVRCASGLSPTGNRSICTNPYAATSPQGIHPLRYSSTYRYLSSFLPLSIAQITIANPPHAGKNGAPELVTRQMMKAPIAASGTHITQNFLVSNRSRRCFSGFSSTWVSGVHFSDIFPPHLGRNIV